MRLWRHATTARCAYRYRLLSRGPRSLGCAGEVLLRLRAHWSDVRATKDCSVDCLVHKGLKSGPQQRQTKPVRQIDLAHRDPRRLIATDSPEEAGETSVWKSITKPQACVPKCDHPWPATRQLERLGIYTWIAKVCKRQLKAPVPESSLSQSDLNICVNCVTIAQSCISKQRKTWGGAGCLRDSCSEWSTNCSRRS